jgi:carbamoyl-phosphate synthase large subunit
MRSTGEVMGIDKDLGMAFAKSQIAAQPGLPTSGNVFISVKDHDKEVAAAIAQKFHDLGFNLYSTSGTANFLSERGIPVTKTYKLSEGARPNVVDMVKNGSMDLIINTPSGMAPRLDENRIREEALLRKVPIITTIMGAHAAIQGIKALKGSELKVMSLQEYNALLKK